MEIVIKAYAKINLSLEILERLVNGYHKIRSIFQAINLYDFITISKEERDFYLTGSIICPQKENLITKAKETLENFINRKLPCRIHIIKNIPISAGLGGGSSDAAATLVGLNKLYSLNLNSKQVMEIGLKVGSDVPFFVSNIGTALVEGVGEKMKPIKRKLSKFYVLARPHKRIATSKMYQLFDDRKKNFFELAQEICPSVKGLSAYFSSVSNECDMSGSGPTIFAGFDSYNKAMKAIENFGIEKFDGDFFICKPSTRTYEIM